MMVSRLKGAAFSESLKFFLESRAQKDGHHCQATAMQHANEVTETLWAADGGNEDGGG